MGSVWGWFRQFQVWFGIWTVCSLWFRQGQGLVVQVGLVRFGVVGRLDHPGQPFPLCFCTPLAGLSSELGWIPIPPFFPTILDCVGGWGLGGCWQPIYQVLSLLCSRLTPHPMQLTIVIEDNFVTELASNIGKYWVQSLFELIDQRFYHVSISPIKVVSEGFHS